MKCVKLRIKDLSLWSTPEGCRSILILFYFMFLRITIGVISNCLPDGFWMLQTEFACCSHKRVRDTNEVTPLGTSEQHRHNRDERCKQIREGGCN